MYKNIDTDDPTIEFKLLKKISGASYKEFKEVLAQFKETKKKIGDPKAKLVFNKRNKNFEVIERKHYEQMTYDPSIDTFLGVDMYNRDAIFSKLTPNKFRRDKFVYTDKDIKEAFYHLYEQGLV